MISTCDITMPALMRAARGGRSPAELLNGKKLRSMMATTIFGQARLALLIARLALLICRTPFLLRARGRRRWPLMARAGPPVAQAVPDDANAGKLSDYELRRRCVEEGSLVIRRIVHCAKSPMSMRPITWVRDGGSHGRARRSLSGKSHATCFMHHALVNKTPSWPRSGANSNLS